MPHTTFDQMVLETYSWLLKQGWKPLRLIAYIKTPLFHHISDLQQWISAQVSASGTFEVKLIDVKWIFAETQNRSYAASSMMQGAMPADDLTGRHYVNPNSTLPTLVD